MKYRKTVPFISLSLLFLSPLNVPGQNLEIQVGKNIQLNEALPNEQFFEPYISAHPNKPNHLLAVGWVNSTLKKRDSSVERCAAFVSNNGGQSWDRSDLPNTFCADPWVSLTEKGAVLTALDMETSNQLFAYFSSDGGQSWDKNVQSLGYFHDGPRSTFTKDGSIFIASHQSARDGDNIRRTAIYVGKSMKPNRRGYQYIEKKNLVFPSNLNLAIDGVATLSDGSLAIIYQDFQRHVKGPQKDENGNWRGILKTRREWLISSKDGGRTFTFPKMITESCYDRANDLVADTTDGAFKDRLYSACGGDNGTSILFMYSKGEYKGDYWSDATPIELPATLKGERRDPHIAVNKDGMVAVAWLDNRDSPDKCVTPYITVSTDGGETFAKPVRVGDSLSCPNDKAGKHVTESGRWSWGGDYFGLTAAADGRFHVLWPDARSGKFELMTAAVSVSKN